MTLPTDEEIRNTLQREVDENGHKWRFTLQVSRYVHQRMREADLFPTNPNGHLEVHVVDGWKPELMGSCWEEPTRDHWA